MTTEKETPIPSNKYVKVLYDYEYTDDANRVWMKEDEVFHLLNTESNEWWQVSRLESPESTFYVPSTYVEILSTGNRNSYEGDGCTQTGYNGHEVTTFKGKYELNTFNNNIKMDNEMGPDEAESDYMNIERYKMPQGTDGNDFTVQYIPSAKKPSDMEDCGDYANLEDFRKAANIPQTTQQLSPPQSPGESDYANMEQLHLKEPQRPNVQECKYEKTLMDTWDQYLDPLTNRLFYMHNKTNEIQWKPPRGQYHSELKNKREQLAQSGEYEDVYTPLPKLQNRKSRSVDFGRPRLSLETKVPEGWSYGVSDTGEAVFTENDTQDKRSGGSSPTKSPTSDPEEKREASDQVSSQKLTERPRKTQVSERFQKSRSVMIETLHFTAPPNNAGPPPPKSATLPPNFTSAIPEAPVEEQALRRGSTPDTQHSQPFSQSVNINEPIEGVLNKCKLSVNGKKPAKKWAFSYVKLSGSNLLFYKDQKSSQPTKNQPHGKYEQIVALVECSLEKDPKALTSKRNTICITTPEYHILLQADDDAKITEWLIKLHTKIKELGGKPDPPDSEAKDMLGPPVSGAAIGKRPSFKKHKRQDSDGGSLEKRRGVRDYLSKFMTTRAEKDKLVKKGIYKDAVFGSDISQLCEKEKTKVPVFVTRSIEAIENRGLKHEGLYRIGGNVSQIQTLRCAVDQGINYDLDDPEIDINVLGGCLKLFFRELKEPLFTYGLFDKFLKSFLKENASDRLKAIKATVNELPKCNYETVHVLFKHLVHVMDNHLENKMHAHQLAIVFGPTLIWPEVQTGNLATSMVYQSRIVEFILLEFKNIFR